MYGKKLILFTRNILAGRINYKMLKYHTFNRLRRSPASQYDDDFNWSNYTLHYEGELELGHKTRTLCLEFGDYRFSERTLIKQRDILPLHPNVHLLYETILQLSPLSVLEVGCGGGDNLHNLKVLRPQLEVFGNDISDDQLDLLRSRHSYLSPLGRKLDITKCDSFANPVDLIFTQAVIMHIGTQERRHLIALENLFKTATRYVLLMENWSKHSFLDDIHNLMATGRIPWHECYLYYRQNLHNPDVKILVASSTPLNYPPLNDYATLLNTQSAR